MNFLNYIIVNICHTPQLYRLKLQIDHETTEGIKIALPCV